MKLEKRPLPPGPWDNEPDRVEFEHAGLTCLILRTPLGHLCGYVAVPEGHACHGTDQDECPVRVHGGLTWSNKSDEFRTGDGLWWFGFDCAHLGDLSPGLGETFPGDEYRDITFVRAETEQLAKQLKELT